MIANISYKDIIKSSELESVVFWSRSTHVGSIGDGVKRGSGDVDVPWYFKKRSTFLLLTLLLTYLYPLPAATHRESAWNIFMSYLMQRDSGAAYS